MIFRRCGMAAGICATAVAGVSVFSAPVARADDFGLGDVLSDLVVTASTAELTDHAVDQALAASATGAETLSAAPLFQQYVYDPLHVAVESWINSSFGEQVDHLLNTVSGQFLIGNGVDGTMGDPNGGDGGVWLGDGGNGWDSTEAGFMGGSGGDAEGFFGNGGDGGLGGAGAAGGDGGDAGSLFGIGGDGGNAGAGATATGLPALGGAGGNAGTYGEHGMVGDFGTLPEGPTADPEGSLLPLGGSGGWLTNSDGEVVLLHGLNDVYKVATGDPATSGFGDDDAAFLAANGFNAVRVGVIWSDLEPNPGVFDSGYLNSIEQTVQTLGNHGIYSIIDFHQDAYSTAFGGEGAPDWAVQTDGVADPSLPFPYNEFFNPAEQQAWESFWSNANAPNGIGLENNYSQMLEYVGSAFNGNSNVAGFELMNEPSPGVASFLPTLFGNPFFDSQQLTPFYDQGAAAIRAVDPSTPIFFEPNVLSNAGIPTDLGTVDASNTVLSFHDYCEFDLGPLGCIPSVSGIVGNAESFLEAQEHGIPAFMTEFGATSDQAQILAPMQGADQHLIGWTEWAYSGQGDISTSANPPGSESLVYNPMDPPVGANVNTANLETLVEPHPQAISGIPTSYSFDNGTLQFSYSTDQANGLGTFAAGSQTTISIPTVEFPNGYQVSVTGGDVLSAPNAAQLVIASNAGASAVTVTVRAAGT
ncbi:cellulase family glycosylhydrolase [Mycobacterium sp.]|uniref:cellulase family glycosylhydrolase n=1 Tax=Mycobacterium sp. TaxID=1785 RepID=UPI003D0B4834